MAIESLNALDGIRKVPAAPDDFARRITESALPNNAIVLYVRATKTRSDERGDFDPRSRFNEEQKVVHQELIDLRDAAIAHFGSGGSYRGEWQAELVILQFKGDEAKPAVATRRKTFDRTLTERARVQIEFAHDLFRALSLQKLGELTDELNGAAAASPDFHKEIDRHPLNLNVFLASPDAGEAARASFDQVYVKGSVRHS